MSDYELVLVLKAKDKVALPGKAGASKDWGVRDLAYPIKGQKQGYYIQLELKLLPAEVKAVDQALKHNDNVLRYLLVKEK